MIPLPAYIDPEAWAGFVEMRRKIKAPLTDRAAKLILIELQRIKDAGHDPNEALDQSTMKGWRGVFQPRRAEIEVAPEARQEQERRLQQAEAQRVQEYIQRTVRRVA